MRFIKQLCFLVCTLAVLTIPTRAAQDTPMIVVSSPVATAGDTVDVTISLLNNPGVVSMRLFISYDESAMSLIQVSDGGILGEYYHQTDAESLKKCPYTLFWMNGLTSDDYRQNGVLATLSFALKPDAVGSFPITISYDYAKGDILNQRLDKVFFEVEDGAVTVEAPPLVGSLGSDLHWSFFESRHALRITGTKNAGETILAACYSEQGQMLRVLEIKSDDALILPDAAKKVSLFLLNSYSVPVCGKATVK